MADTITFSVRTDRETKQQCEELYKSLGFSLNIAVNAFMRQSVYAGGFPFELRHKNESREFLEALEDDLRSAQTEEMLMQIVKIKIMTLKEKQESIQRYIENYLGKDKLEELKKEQLL